MIEPTPGSTRGKNTQQQTQPRNHNHQTATQPKNTPHKHKNKTMTTMTATTASRTMRGNECPQAIAQPKNNRIVVRQTDRNAGNMAHTGNINTQTSTHAKHCDKTAQQLQNCRNATQSTQTMHLATQLRQKHKCTHNTCRIAESRSCKRNKKSNTNKQTYVHTMSNVVSP